MRTIDGVDVALAVHPYDQRVRRFVLAAKNGGRRDVLRRLGGQLAAALVAESSPIPPGWLDRQPTVVWVPASRDRRRRRGYDQGRLLARAVGHGLGLPVTPLLSRSGVEAQEGRSRAERLSGPQVRCRVSRAPADVLLVDDVITTGASLAAAATTLRRAGTSFIVGATVASADDRPGNAGLGPVDRPMVRG